MNKFLVKHSDKPDPAKTAEAQGSVDLLDQPGETGRPVHRVGRASRECSGALGKTYLGLGLSGKAGSPLEQGRRCSEWFWGPNTRHAGQPQRPCHRSLASPGGSPRRSRWKEEMLEVHDIEARPGPPRDPRQPRNVASAYWRPDGRPGDRVDEETLKLMSRGSARPPRHAQKPQQPRHGLSCRRPGGRGDRDARRDASAEEGEAGPRPSRTLGSRNNLAAAYRPRVGRRRRSEFEETLKLSSEARPRPPRHAQEPQQPRRGLPGRRRTAEAIPMLEETLKLRTAKLGPDHPDTLASRNNLAVAYRRRPDAEAIAHV